MREILFKAKRLDNGEWVEGNLITNEKNESKKYIGYIFDERNGVIEDFDIVEVIPDTLCQFTGLTDKNGKRTSDEQKIEQNSHYAEMETCKPPDDASAAFHRQAYQSIDVIDYIRKIHKGGGAGGKSKTDKREKIRCKQT